MFHNGIDALQCFTSMLVVCLQVFSPVESSIMDVEGGSSSAMEEADEQSCSDTAESGQPRAKLMRANSDENTSKTMIKNEKGKPSREDEHLIEKPLSACSSPSIGPISGSATLVADGVPRSCPMLADHTTPAAPKSPVAAGSYATQTQASDQQEFKPEPSENSLAADVSLATSTQGNNHTEMRTDPTSGDAPPSVPTEQPVQEPLQEGVGLQQNEAGSSSVPGSSLARVALAYRTDESNCETSDASEDSDDSADIEARWVSWTTKEALNEVWSVISCTIIIPFKHVAKTHLLMSDVLQ